MPFVLSPVDIEALHAHLWEHLEPSGSTTVAPVGCDHTLRHSRAWLRERFGRRSVAPLARWLENRGGFCDCEVLMNVDTDPITVGED